MPSIFGRSYHSTKKEKKDNRQPSASSHAAPATLSGSKSVRHATSYGQTGKGKGIAIGEFGTVAQPRDLPTPPVFTKEDRVRTCITLHIHLSTDFDPAPLPFGELDRFLLIFVGRRDGSASLWSSGREGEQGCSGSGRCWEGHCRGWQRARWARSVDSPAANYHGYADTEEGVTIPMLFSSQALEINQTRTRMLIQSFLDIMQPGQRPPSGANLAVFFQDIRFAKEYELAWLLRWVLARIVRLREATREVCRGLIEWDVYEEWRGLANYPADAFPFLSSLVSAEVYNLILIPLFSLLSRFAAHSLLSGLTPHALSSLFAPLVFDVPTSSPVMTAHAIFVRSASATEHLLLAYIRSSGHCDGLGISNLPSRLKEWVNGYPAMVATDGDLARGGPRRGARVVRCERISRTVRAYTRDLIVGAESWALDIPQRWEAWDRVTLRHQKGETRRPKFSSNYRRRLVVREPLPLPTASGSTLQHNMTYAITNRSGTELETRRAEHEDQARWGSRAGKEWSTFEEGGFGASFLANTPEGENDIQSKLQFDLTETAKTSISERRKTMDWGEFASPAGGFNRTDPILDVSLTFSDPVAQSISAWPSHQEELRRRLHKSHKEATPFNYDTTPRVGNAAAQDPGSKADAQGRIYVEEAFINVWADLMLGAGWTDREERTFREANWAFVEYKATPVRPEDPPLGDALTDPRTSELYFLFEEKVPLEYQIAVADPKEKKTFAMLFSPSQKKKALPVSQSAPGKLGTGWEESDFDRMLLHRERTKKLTIPNKADHATATVWQLNTDKPLQPVSPTRSLTTRGPTHHFGNRNHRTDDAKLTEGKASFFFLGKNRASRRSNTEESTRERETTKRYPQKEHEVDFDVKSASGVSSDDNSPDQGKASRTRRDDDKWMDILVSNGARRMDRQDAALPLPRDRPVAMLLPPDPVFSQPAPDMRQPSLNRGNPGPNMSRLYHVHPYHTPETSDQQAPLGSHEDDLSSSYRAASPYYEAERSPYYEEELRSPYDPEEPHSDDDDSHSYGDSATIEDATPREARFEYPLPVLSPLSDGHIRPVPELPNEDYAHKSDHAHDGGDLTDSLNPFLLGKIITPTSPVSPTQASFSRTEHDVTEHHREASPDHTQAALRTEVRGGSADIPGYVVNASSQYTREGSPTYAQRAMLETLGKALPATPPTETRRRSQSDNRVSQRRSPEILAPQPKRDRDTIHNIVDHYTDTDREEGHGNPYPQRRTSMVSTASSTIDSSSERALSLRRDSGLGEICIDTEDGVQGGGEDLTPPGPIFDLTPGREPSPARYKHGEPLHFVGEEPEEEELTF